MADHDDTQTSRRDYGHPYGAKNPVPTIQRFRDFKENQRETLKGSSGGDTTGKGPALGHETSRAPASEKTDTAVPEEEEQSKKDIQDHDFKDTSQVPKVRTGKETRRAKKSGASEVAEREITDPVTHLPVKIRDFTEKDLDGFKHDGVDEEASTGKRSRGKLTTSSSVKAPSETGTTLHEDHEEQLDAHDEMSWRLTPPSFQKAGEGLKTIYTRAIIFGLVAIGLSSLFAFWASTFLIYLTSNWYLGGVLVTAFLTTLVAAMGVLVTLGLRAWVQKKFQALWDDELWEAERDQTRQRQQSEIPESALWFNKLLGSIWPLINPDLFSSLADMLEDVMQASLPKFVRMVSVEDLGQGSDSIQILGVRSLPKGAASQSVESDGKLERPIDDKATSSGKGSKSQTSENESKAKGSNARTPETENQDNKEGTPQGHDSSVAAGMQAEEGDFVNLQIAFAYRASHSRREIHERAKHAHLYLAFYLPGNIKIPVWVELRGLIGTARVRLQLTPDPPFVQLATIAFMGQPKVDISCVPVIKHGLNIMDVPIISNFVQTAVNAAMAEYVAPKSLTLDLKSMISGDDFKRDTSSRGILRVRIKRAFGFKAGDGAIPLIGDGASDPYVSVGWAKFGKAIWSTRVLVDEMEPYWEEETYVLVSAKELDAEESLRVQLWDSDRATADDDLGRIEVPVKELMKNEKSKGRMWDRTDTFQAMKKGEKLPGRLEWSVGYFAKTRLMDYQVKQASKDQNIKTVEQFKQQSFEQSGRKLRETSHNETPEVDQLRKQDFDEAAVEVISNSSPSEDYPSGILSVVVHQILGLEIEEQNRPRDADGGEKLDEEDESSVQLPDSYCTIMINDNRIYKTRTKPKTRNPFFNAGTERFIRDWRTTSIMVSVRDARVHENDALLGVVSILLGPTLLSHKMSRFDGYHPIAGGIGYGRVRISVVFRSVQMQLPSNMLGWDYGTLEISPEMNWVGDEVPDEVKHCKIKVRTVGGKGKLYPASQSTHGLTGLTKGTMPGLGHSHLAEVRKEGRTGGIWAGVRSEPLMIPARNRYAQPLVFEFRSHSRHHHQSEDQNSQYHLSPLSPTAILGSKSSAFAILWLSAIPDEEEQDLELVVWRFEGAGKQSNMHRAEHNVLPGSLCGQKIGLLSCKVRFWRGMGVAHKEWEKKSEHLHNTMESLRAARDEGLITGIVGDGEWLKARERGEQGDRGESRGQVDGYSQDSSDSDDDDEAERKLQPNGVPKSGLDAANPRVGDGLKQGDHIQDSDAAIGDKKKICTSEDNTPRDVRKRNSITSRGRNSLDGLVGQLKDYAKNRHELHRKQRGIMQWKAPRTVDWLKQKGEHAVDKVVGKLQHHDRKPGIETEV